MIAYHGNPEIKARVLAQLTAHARADEIVQGYGYWQGGRGCAVGCTIHSGEHAEYETRFGIPQMIARLEDRIFEGLPVARARKWPIQFASAIVPGADLSRVGWLFLHWLLTDAKVNPRIEHPIVRGAIKRCAVALVPLTKGQPVDVGAAWSAESAAYSAAWGAGPKYWNAARCAAWSAARSAASAAYALMADKLLALLRAAPQAGGEPGRRGGRR